MKSLTPVSALVPAPRGPLPNICAVAVASVSTAAAAILFREKLLSWVSVATLLLTSGPALHRFFQLLEEMLHHRNRYRGRSSLTPVSACGLDKSLLSVGVSCVVLYLCGSPLPLSQLWVLVWFCPVFFTAFSSLGLESSISSFCASHRDSAPLWSRGSRRLLLLVPIDANISHKLEDEDDRVRFYESLPNSQLDRGGVRGRVSVLNLTGSKDVSKLISLEMLTKRSHFSNGSRRSSCKSIL